MTERQRPYYVCDGCGYVIDTDSEHGMLILQFRPRYQTGVAPVKHFHGPRELQGTSLKGNLLIRDCLDYWWHNRKARELAEGKDW